MLVSRLTINCFTSAWRDKEKLVKINKAIKNLLNNGYKTSLLPT